MLKCAKWQNSTGDISNMNVVYVPDPTKQMQTEAQPSPLHVIGILSAYNIIVLT